MTKKPPLRCIFCRGTALTQEHVIPDWVQEIIPKEPWHGTLYWVRSSPDPPRLRQGPLISRKVRVVCKHCNTGWLSVLEDELKPRIKDLVLGNPLTLTPWDQRRVAAWAAKTTMTAEFIHPESAAITFEEREFLRLHREPPAAFNVWVGHYGGPRYTSDILHYSAHISVGPPASPETAASPNAQSTIIGLGKLVIQTASSSHARAEFKLGDEGAGNLRRIWPPAVTDLPWPPATSLNDENLELIRVRLDTVFTDTN